MVSVPNMTLSKSLNNKLFIDPVIEIHKLFPHNLHFCKFWRVLKHSESNAPYMSEMWQSNNIQLKNALSSELAWRKLQSGSSQHRCDVSLAVISTAPFRLSCSPPLSYSALIVRWDNQANQKMFTSYYDRLLASMREEMRRVERKIKNRWIPMPNCSYSILTLIKWKYSEDSMRVERQQDISPVL